MKKLMVSLAAAPLLLSAVASADVDVKVGGQAVIYYETHQSGADNAPDMLDKDASAANVGVQMNLGADLGNNFTFGSQLTYLGTLGLENNLVSGIKQGDANNQVAGGGTTTDDIMLTKLFIAKKIANTTFKLGRQELPKSLSPLAFTEGWNVFKNTFDAALAINTDLPKTTIVGAWVGNAGGIMPTNGINKTVYGDMVTIGLDGAYMLTAQTKLIPLTTLTLTYYDVTRAAQAFWADAQVGGKSLPMGIKLGLQYGMITPEDVLGTDDTTAFGVKAGATVGPVYLQAAFSSVDDGSVAVKNLGTGIKTPLYTQMIYNQNAIAKDADTFVIKGVYNTGDYGKIIAQYGMTSAGKKNINGENDYNELDLIYKVKAGGVTYWASAMIINTDKEGGIIGAPGADTDSKVRLWGRYNF